MPSVSANDACKLLDADHIAVKHLFVEYARLAYAPASDDEGDRAAIAMKIGDELTVHAQIEEEIFYPALRKAVPDTADVLDEAKEEHQQVKNLVSQLRGHTAADAMMDELVAKLASAVEHHVKEERDELFPKARSAKGMDLGSLGMQMQERQRELEAAQGAQ